jgi:hypothetical protein
MFSKTAKARREISFPLDSPVAKVLADNCAAPPVLTCS